MAQGPDDAPVATITSVEVDEAGGLVVVKRSPDGSPGRERLHREARVLDAARQPGVVDLAASADSNGQPAVITRWVGPTTLEGLGSLQLSQAAAIMAALATSVADLHELGIVHGAIAAEHVLLAPDGRPVLCGFGRARLVASGGGAPELTAEDDVEALGCLLRQLTGEEVDLEPIPERRGWRRKPRWQGYHRRALLTLADQATHDEVRMRPTARALAATIHDTIPEARLTPISQAPDISSGRLAGLDPPGSTAVPCRREPEPPAESAESGHEEIPASASPLLLPGPRPIKLVSNEVVTTDQPPAGIPLAGDSPRASPADPVRQRPHDPLTSPAAAVPTGAHSQDSHAPRPPGPGRSIRIGTLPVEPPRPTSGARSYRRVLPALAGVLGVAMLLFGVKELRHQRSEPGGTAAAHAFKPATVTTQEPPAPTKPAIAHRAARPQHRSTSGNRPSHPCHAAPRGIDLDGDHCPDPARVAGTTVLARGIRYSVGRAHDRVVLGDWNCDGRATPALLRPATGQVFVFPRWALRGARITIGPTAQVPDAVGLEAVRRGKAGCSQLRVRTANGRAVVVTARSEP